MRCSCCKEDLPEENFYRQTKITRGRQSSCKTCVRTDPRQIAGRERWRRKARYGVDQEWIDTRSDAQGGMCAICGVIPEAALHIDHDHRTGAARSLLCGNCNRGLGMFFDSPHIFAIAIEYLESHQREVA